MDTTVIERLARLRGIGDAYHDYRGELRYFSLETKADILRAMGCAVDDPAALAAELEPNWRSSGGARCCRRSPRQTATRIGVDLNISARDFGAESGLDRDLENGERRNGVDVDRRLSGNVARRGRGSWITRRRFELPLELPPGYHELRGEDRRRSGAAAAA